MVVVVVLIVVIAVEGVQVYIMRNFTQRYLKNFLEMCPFVNQLLKKNLRLIIKTVPINIIPVRDTIL